MNVWRDEVRLNILYSTTAVLSIFTLGSVTAAWQHWGQILDLCSEGPCGCILFANSLLSGLVTGSATPICHFAAFAPLAIFAVSLVLIIYQSYRICKGKRVVTKDKRGKHFQKVMKHEGQNREGAFIEKTCWIPLTVLAIFMSIYAFSIAVLLTAGYHKTCEEYRPLVVEITNAVGQQAVAIHSRLSCGSIFDYMDYLMPVTLPNTRRDEIKYGTRWEPKDLTRGEFINTAISLQIAITTAWLNFLSWIAIIVTNIRLEKYRRKYRETNF